MLCRCMAWTNFRLRKSLGLKGFRGALRRVGSPSRWAQSERVQTTRSPNCAARPSNGKSSKTTRAGEMLPPAAARSSGGWSATHDQAQFILQPPQPRQLSKEPDTRYAAGSRVTTNPVSTHWRQGLTKARCEGSTAIVGGELLVAFGVACGGGGHLQPLSRIALSGRWFPCLSVDSTDLVSSLRPHCERGDPVLRELHIVDAADRFAVSSNQVESQPLVR